MENKFSLKDFVIIVILLGILVSIWLAMLQFDRQWDDIKSLKSDLANLTSSQAQVRADVTKLHQKIDAGLTVSSYNNSNNVNLAAEGYATDLPDPFDRISEMRAADDFAEGDMLVDAFGTRIKSVTALTYADLYGRRIQSFVIEPLVTQDPDTLEYKPLIAESWKIEDNSEAYRAWKEEKTAALNAELEADPTLIQEEIERITKSLAEAEQPIPAEGEAGHDALIVMATERWIESSLRNDVSRPSAVIITFKIRRGVNFSDGTPLTARDVEFSWRLLNNPRIDAPQTRNFYDNVESYRALDDYTVEFRLREPHYLAFGMVSGFGVLPEHFYSRFSTDEMNNKPGLLMGSGPYRLENPETWVPGRPMILVRNENYWGERPGFNKLRWLEIEQDVPRLISFKNGEIDFFSATPEQFEELKKDPRVQERFAMHNYSAIPSGYSFIAWNTRREGQPTIFSDKRVRQAMTYLIDRERIAREVMLGYASPTSGPFPEGSPQADPEIEPRSYDYDRAMTLLREAGWSRGPDNVLIHESGKRFEFTLTYPSGNDTYDRIMLFLTDSLREAGIIMRQDPQQWSVFIERVDGRNFDACALAWGGGAIEGDIRQMFHSSQIAGGANNFTSYANTELDALIDQARSTLDEQERMKLWQACHRILYEDQPYTFMHRRESLNFIHQRIKNVQRITTGLNDRDEWYVPAAAQMRK